MKEVVKDECDAFDAEFEQIKLDIEAQAQERAARKTANTELPTVEDALDVARAGRLVLPRELTSEETGHALRRSRS